MNSRTHRGPLVLCILDGWGERPTAADNAIEAARTPNWHRLLARWPHAHLQASEHYVGLPDGQMGNSEVGHTNIGAGRLVLQDLPRIDAAIAAGELAAMPALRRFIGKLHESGGTAHLIGLMSPVGCIRTSIRSPPSPDPGAKADMPVAVHAFLDGRDTPPKSAAAYLEKFRRGGRSRDLRIATVCGRFYAMDRDQRWDRVEKAYRLIVPARAKRPRPDREPSRPPMPAAKPTSSSLPTAIAGYGGMQRRRRPLIANFRADRVREIATALLDPDFSGFRRDKRISFAAALGLVEYSTEAQPLPRYAVSARDLADTFGEVVSKPG